jgi:hypothetical protein
MLYDQLDFDFLLKTISIKTPLRKDILEKKDIAELAAQLLFPIFIATEVMGNYQLMAEIDEIAQGYPIRYFINIYYDYEGGEMLQEEIERIGEATFNRYCLEFCIELWSRKILTLEHLHFLLPLIDNNQFLLVQFRKALDSKVRCTP